MTTDRTFTTFKQPQKQKTQQKQNCWLHQSRQWKLFSSSAEEEQQQQQQQASFDGNNLNDEAIQWELFQRYHARGDDTITTTASSSSYKGIWTTYDYMGDVIDETIASVDYIKSQQQSIQQVHSIVMGAKRSDCATCFDSMEIKSFPVAIYTPDTLLKKRVRCAACSLVHGPTLIRRNTNTGSSTTTSSSIMATELCLSHGDGRVRVNFQHAPVWQKDIEPGSCPPQGLKLIRCMISREAMREAPPTAETEANNKNTDNNNNNPIFYRPVSPFHWHKKWSGSSWTWGPQTGNRGWAIEELDDDADAWHGNAPVEFWNLRLPGGIFVQAPRVVTDAQVGLCRLAWLPTDETLLRVEAGVVALQPILTEEEDMMVAFEPPSLVSLRCDMLRKIGDLDGEPKFIKEQQRQVEARNVQASETSVVQQESLAALSLKEDLSAPSPESDHASSAKRDDTLDSEQAVRDAIQL